MSFFTHRGKPYLGDVKDQGKRGCCSALAVVNLFESYAHRRGDFVKLSAQEVFDFGGYNVLSDVNYVMSNGLMYEKDWPLTNSIFEHSRELHSRVPIYSPRYRFPEFSKAIVINSEEELVQHIEDHPVVVATSAWPNSYFHAFEAIDDWEVCELPEDDGPPGDIGYAMLLVGHGTTERGVDYYEVKNSAGEEWGENGYGRISRDFPLKGVVPI